MVIKPKEGTNKIEINFENSVVSLVSIEQWSKDTIKKSIINHPVITIYLTHFWYRECFKIYLMYLISYIIFCILHVMYLLGYLKNCFEFVFLMYILIFLVIFIAVEVAQFYCKPLQYFYDINNYLELLLVFYTIESLMLIKEMDEIHLQAYPYGYNVGLLFIVLYCIIGEIPKLSKFIILYKKVLWNFIKHMFMYSLILIGFSLMFLTFNVNDLMGLNQRNVSSSIFTTYILFFGEYNSDEREFESMPYHYMAFFLVCLLCIPMVLNNVLIGLTISDMESIKEDAEFSENMERLNSISSFRKVQNFLRDNEYMSACLKNFCRNFINMFILKHKKDIEKGRENAVIIAIYKYNHLGFMRFYKNISSMSLYIDSKMWQNLYAITDSDKISLETIFYMLNKLDKKIK